MFFFFRLTANRMQQMRLAKTGIAIKKQRVICIPGRLAYRHTACMGQPVTRPNNKIFKRIVRMKPDRRLRRVPADSIFEAMYTKLEGYKMARNLLGCFGSACIAASPSLPVACRPLFRWWLGGRASLPCKLLRLGMLLRGTGVFSFRAAQFG